MGPVIRYSRFKISAWKCPIKFSGSNFKIVLHPKTFIIHIYQFGGSRIPIINSVEIFVPKQSSTRPVNWPLMINSQSLKCKLCLII